MSNFFFHSFCRPRRGETPDETLTRALTVLELLNDVGLVLAPELVAWDTGAVGKPGEKLELLQRRVCFTELPLDDLPTHAVTFGPISLQFGIDVLRKSGATPVIYAPQGLEGEPISHIGCMAVKAAWHTRAVLAQFQQLKEFSDPARAVELFGYPQRPDMIMHLNNSDENGNTVIERAVPARFVKDVIDYINFNNIPFDHSVGMLSMFLNMFYPTDNDFKGEVLGYYRQREWRLIGEAIQIHGKPITRDLAVAEAERVLTSDPQFWGHELTYDGDTKRRIDWAQVYAPADKWSPIQLAERVYVPAKALDRARAIAGNKVTPYG